MKIKKLFGMIVCLLLALPVHADDDILITRDGKMARVKVEKISTSQVFYKDPKQKKLGTLDVPATFVYMILKEKGKNIFFDEDGNQMTSPVVKYDKKDDVVFLNKGEMFVAYNLSVNRDDIQYQLQDKKKAPWITTKKDDLFLIWNSDGTSSLYYDYDSRHSQQDVAQPTPPAVAPQAPAASNVAAPVAAALKPSGEQTTPIANVQRGEPFEGEIVYETYENYSDYILKMANSIYFNGVHKVRLIVKGDWMHMIDETTGCHIIVNDAAARAIMNAQGKRKSRNTADLLSNLSKNRSNNSCSYVHFCDHTKTGLDMSDAPGTQYMLSPGEIYYADGTTAPITQYTFDKTAETKNILGLNCPFYEGTVARKMGGMDQSYDVKAWVSDDLTAPAGYNWNLYGLDVPGIALKWATKYDGGHVSVMSVGELSFYIEADVVEVIPRPVDDEEFNIPEGYKIKSGGTSNVFKMLGYYKSVKKELIKRGIKGGDNSQKTTGVHFKTDGEWDF